MEFSEIFEEYFSQLRGQASAIPTFGDREYTRGIVFCNSAIKKWERADGQLWRELITTAGEQDLDTFPLVAKTIDGNTLSYPAPLNMRKPPAYVRFYTSASNYKDVKVSPPEQAQSGNALDSIIWFSGGANTGFTMHIGSNLAGFYGGWLVDYVYMKRATRLSTTVDPSAVLLEMSDPNYAIQDMLCSAFTAARNGFGYKVANKEKGIALMNMKLEDSSGTYGASHALGKLDSGWGVNTPVNDIKL